MSSKTNTGKRVPKARAFSSVLQSQDEQRNSKFIIQGDCAEKRIGSYVVNAAEKEYAINLQGVIILYKRQSHLLMSPCYAHFLKYHMGDVQSKSDSPKRSRITRSSSCIVSETQRAHNLTSTTLKYSRFTLVHFQAKNDFILSETSN